MSPYIFHVDPPSIADVGDEFTIQIAFIARMKLIAPTVRIVATPNGQRRTAWEGIRAKREGLRSGEPDLRAYWSNGLDARAVPGFALLEFKAKTGVLKPDQITALNWYHRHGFPCGVFRSVDSAVGFLRGLQAPFSMAMAA